MEQYTTSTSINLNTNQYDKLVKHLLSKHFDKPVHEICINNKTNTVHLICEQKIMSIKLFIEFFSPNLHLRKNGNIIEFVDRYYEYDESHDKGVYHTIKNNYDIMTIYNPLTLIPAYYFDNFVENLFRNDFPNKYNMDDETIRHIERNFNFQGFKHLDEICLKYKQQEAYAYLHDICEVCRRDCRLVISESDIDKNE